MDKAHNNRAFTELRDTLRSKWNSKSGKDNFETDGPAIRYGYENRVTAKR